MTRLRLSLGIGMLMAVLAATPSRAQTTIGGTGEDNCFPFGCEFGNHYQQVYAGSAFGGPTTFNALTFFNSVGGYVAPGTYTFSFSVTSKTPSTLDATYANNVGSPLTFFSTLVATANAVGGNSFTVTGNSYSFDPTSGNLLLDIQYNQASSGSGYLYFVAGPSTDVGRVYGSDPTGNNNNLAQNYGLLTRFDETTVTPEPASLLLLGTGMLGLAAATRRKRS